MHWFQTSNLLAHASPFVEDTITMFPKGQDCSVTDAIGPYRAGRVKARGSSWRAELFEISCQATLRPAQPALAIGRRNNVLIVIPYHCLLWNQYLEEYSLWLKATDIEIMDRHERGWRL